MPVARKKPVDARLQKAFSETPLRAERVKAVILSGISRYRNSDCQIVERPSAWAARRVVPRKQIIPSLWQTAEETFFYDHLTG